MALRQHLSHLRQMLGQDRIEWDFIDLSAVYSIAFASGLHFGSKLRHLRQVARLSEMLFAREIEEATGDRRGVLQARKGRTSDWVDPRFIPGMLDMHRDRFVAMLVTFAHIYGRDSNDDSHLWRPPSIPPQCIGSSGLL